MTRQRAPGDLPDSLFRILRYFSVASLASILAAAFLLTLLYRHVAVRDLVLFGERGNQMLVQGFLDATHAPLLDYLESAPRGQGKTPPPDLLRAIEALMRNSSVTRVNIYDPAGMVLFSTEPGLVGSGQGDLPGFQTSIKGRVQSRLVYRDHFNPLDRETESDNLIDTYIPMRRNHAAPIQGVFEINSDVSPLVARLERAEVLILGGSVAILALLYLALLAIVRHAERIIAAQQNTIRDRNHALEQLSTQLLTAHEDEKKRLAVELHEGIAQTLSSIKYQMEAACHNDGHPCPRNFRPNAEIVPVLQQTIKEVRTLAMDLRPSSLDDLGLLPTVEWYCREFRAIYPDIDLRFSSHAEEGDIPQPLRVVLFRLIQQMLLHLARQTCASLVHLQLRKSGGRIRLVLTDNCPVAETSPEQAAEREVHLLTLRERITLAGGDMEIITPDETIGSTLRASWMA